MYHANIFNFLLKILKRDLIAYDFAVSLKGCLNPFTYKVSGNKIPKTTKDHG